MSTAHRAISQSPVVNQIKKKHFGRQGHQSKQDTAGLVWHTHRGWTLETGAFSQRKCVVLLKTMLEQGLDCQFWVAANNSNQRGLEHLLCHLVCHLLCHLLCHLMCECAYCVNALTV